jgi:hypothetical protein
MRAGICGATCSFERMGMLPFANRRLIKEKTPPGETSITILSLKCGRTSGRILSLTFAASTLHICPVLTATNILPSIIERLRGRSPKPYQKAMFLRIQMPGFAHEAKNRREFAPERRPVEQIRRICEGIRGD